MVVNGSVTGFSGPNLFIRIVVTGTAVASVSGPLFTGPNSAQLTVIPADPVTLGSGTHTSTIAVIACSTDINCAGPQLPGSPQTVNVSYQIGQAAIPGTVAPGVGPANVAGQVILRGGGLASATAVSFGATPATALTVISDTEIHASHPALAAGAHLVEIQGPGGPISFGASVKLFAPTVYSITSLNYPIGGAQLRGFAYDAERQALFAALKFPDPLTNQIARYAFASGTTWNLTQVTMANLRDLALSLDGSQLLAISDASIAQVHPITLATTGTTPKPTSIPTPTEYLKSIVVANDGNAVIVAGDNLNFGQFYTYRILANTFSAGQCCYFHPVAGGPANGSQAMIFESGFSSATAAHRYSASSGTISTMTGFTIHHLHQVAPFEENLNPPVFDRGGTRMIAAAFPPDYGVYDASTFARLGVFPTATTFAYAVAPNASRAYTLDVNGGACTVRAFDLGTTPGGSNPLTEITTGGYPVNLGAPCPASNTNSPIRMVLTPGGETLFVAGNANISVVPLP